MDIYWSSFTPAKRDASAYFEDPYFYFPGTGTASELGKYSFLGMLIGGTYETSYKKFGMGVKLLAGIQRAQSPEVKMTTQAKSIVYFLEPIVTYNISQASMVSYDIAYKCEIFAKHRLNSRFHMLYSVIFNNSSCHFSGGTLEIHRDELAVHEEDTYSQEFTKQISYLSFRIGAGINL
jgi:hypothetical protein